MDQKKTIKRAARLDTIPSGWKLTRAGKVCSIRNDLRLPISVVERAKIQGNFPYYGPTGVLDYINEYRLDGEFALIGEDGDHFLKYSEKPQTLIVKGRFNVNNHAHVIESTAQCTAKWFFNFFRHRNITNFLTRQGAGRYKLNKETLTKLPILIPPIKEQIEISNVLSTWDAAIEKTERLIAAKETAKKSLMQRILTGKKRLSGFTKPWREFHLGDLFKERVERGYDHLPLLSITREEGVIPREEVGRKDTSTGDKSKYLRICPGDIGYNTMRMWQGVSALSAYEGIVSPAYTIVIPKKNVDGEFAAYLFKLPKVIHLFYRYSQGLTSDTWNLKFRHFKEIKISIPEVDEQKAISQIFKTSDAELALLRTKFAALQKQKRGLMQKLLTGQWRVKVPEAEEN
ncbi:MAG: restriction endonuclease subunit S [Thermodesulfobacteriota bacterium]|nr:restriction endonuclease subunit S [Thermodesulfobacteriota bacterium]